MKNILTTILLWLTLLSCEHKELCYTHPHGAQFLIEYDWSECDNPNVDIMRILAYPLDGGLPLGYYLAGGNGGELVIQFGEYNLLSYNSDTQSILLQGESSMETIEAYVRTTTITEGVYGVDEPDLPTAIEGQELVITPDDIFKSTYENLISDDEELIDTIQLVMKPLVKHISYQVSGIGNASSIGLIKGALGGVSSYIGVATEQLSTVSSAMVFDGLLSGDTVYGEFDYFGVADNDDTQWLVLFLWGDGGNLRATFDVSQQIADAPDSYNVNIIIETDISMPESISGDDGFSPSVEDWDESDDDNVLVM